MQNKRHYMYNLSGRSLMITSIFSRIFSYNVSSDKRYSESIFCILDVGEAWGNGGGSRSSRSKSSESKERKLIKTKRRRSDSVL